MTFKLLLEMEQQNHSEDTSKSEGCAPALPPLEGRGAGAFTLRYATKDDAALIADISRQTFYDTFAADNTEANMAKFLNEQFTKGKLMLEVGAPGNIFLLAYAEDCVAGYAKLREGKKLTALNSAASMEIARLYVVKEYIGKGVGKLLMQASLDLAKERNKEVVWLGVWERNDRAIRFYSAFGFQKFDECDFLLGDDMQRDWLMKKTISESVSSTAPAFL
jgi:diamine N-acetyltransferase